MIYNDLLKREAEGKPIQVGVSYACWIRSGFVHQVAQMKGMVVRVLADSDTKAAYPKKISSKRMRLTPQWMV
jgi:predicted homoserine dehydrogenase-like protein